MLMLLPEHSRVISSPEAPLSKGSPGQGSAGVEVCLLRDLHRLGMDPKASPARQAFFQLKPFQEAYYTQAYYNSHFIL